MEAPDELLSRGAVPAGRRVWRGAREGLAQMNVIATRDAVQAAGPLSSDTGFVSIGSASR